MPDKDTALSPDLLAIIRAAYARTPYTQGQVAARAGVSERAVWCVLAGRNVNLQTLTRVCAVIGLTVTATAQTDFRSERSA